MMKTTSLTRLGLALVAIAPVAGAQGVPPQPPQRSAMAFTFPLVKAHTLTNGLRVIVVEDHSVPVVAVRAVLGVDDIADPVGKEGLYRVMVGALREGTTTRTPEQIADASTKTGTPVSPTVFTTTPGGLASSLELMGDMLMHPAFPQAGFERRKLQQASAFRSAMTALSTPGRNIFYSLVDGRDDPYVRSLFGTEATVATITRDDVIKFYNDHVGPMTTTIIIVGDETDASALAGVKRVFGDWTSDAKVSLAAFPPAPAPKPTTIYLYDIPSAQTGNIYIGNGGGPSRSAPDAYAAEVAGTITANRFLATLRERRSLIYSGGLAIVWRPDPRRSEFLGQTNVAPAKVDTAIVEWVGMLRALRTTSPPSPEEIENAKRARVGPLWIKTDGPDSVATRIVEAVRDNLAPNFLESYGAGLTHATEPQIVAALQKYIDIDHLVIVVTGDRRRIEPALRAANIAPIVIVDATGKPIE
jgi:zinc protease